jgi:hypothetical protein
MCLWAPRSGGLVYRSTIAFLLSIFIQKNTQDQSVLTEDKNLHVCRLFIFRLQLITISVGM